MHINFNNLCLNKLSCVVVQLLSHVCPCDPVDCSTPGFPVHHHLLELAQTHIHRVGGAIPTISLSVILFFSSFQSSGAPGSFQMSQFFASRGKYWSFSFSISPSNEYSGLISFRIDWFDLLAVQGTLKSLLQHRSSKALILWCSAFFMVQVSYPYTTTKEAQEHRSG